MNLKAQRDISIAGDVVGRDKVTINLTGDFDELPREYALYQNYPNPFSANGPFGNPATTIQYALPQPANVEWAIYNLLGQKVRTLVDREQPAGCHDVVWDGRNDAGMPVGSGIYLYRMKAGRFVETRKMVMMQ
jgi:hypothetical protein